MAKKIMYFLLPLIPVYIAVLLIPKMSWWRYLILGFCFVLYKRLDNYSERKLKAREGERL